MLEPLHRGRGNDLTRASTLLSRERISIELPCRLRLIGVGVTLVFDVASKLAGLGFGCVGQPALDPLDLSIVIRFVFAHVEPLAIIVRRSPNPVIVDVH